MELSAYQIDEHEVSIAQWQNCVGDEACSPLPNHCHEELVHRFDYSEDFPATCVSYEQAIVYCEWAGGRLPTEAQWEKAARGTMGSIFPWGDVKPDCDRANFRLASLYCAEGVVEVGRYAEWRSSFGLWDTVGNVYEWTSDYYDSEYYHKAPSIDPLGPIEDCRSTVGAEPSTCQFRVLRGGAYNCTESVTRGSARSFGAPGLIDINIGLRCAYD